MLIADEGTVDFSHVSVMQAMSTLLVRRKSASSSTFITRLWALVLMMTGKSYKVLFVALSILAVGCCC